MSSPVTLSLKEKSSPLPTVQCSCAHTYTEKHTLAVPRWEKGTRGGAPQTDAGTFFGTKESEPHDIEIKREEKTLVKICKINMYNCIDYVANISTFILVINKYIVAYNV